MKNQLSIFENNSRKKENNRVVNVASVPQRSPFRFPGGKTWLVPTVRAWIKQSQQTPEKFCEPFAGGGIVSLTMAFENLAKKITMGELDDEIASVWDVLINRDFNSLADKIYHFELTPENANMILKKENKSAEERAFATIIKNRISHGGIITKGSGLIKNGENGKGIKSRWYPTTLRKRILAIESVRDKIEFIHGDAFDILRDKKDDPHTYFFLDPPYTKAGKRLYTHFDIDHEKLFFLASCLKGKFMLTYDDTDEIRKLTDKYNLEYKTIPMKTTHHIKKQELIISDNFEWWS